MHWAGSSCVAAGCHSAPRFGGALREQRTRRLVPVDPGSAGGIWCLPEAPGSSRAEIRFTYAGQPVVGASAATSSASSWAASRATLLWASPSGYRKAS